jgi:hypothetical protein
VKLTSSHGQLVEVHQTSLVRLTITSLAVQDAAVRAAKVRMQAKQRELDTQAALIKSVDDMVVAIEEVAVRAMAEVAEKGQNHFYIGWNAGGSRDCSSTYKVVAPSLIADHKKGLDVILTALKPRLPVNLRAEASYWVYQEDRDSGPAIVFSF